MTKHEHTWTPIAPEYLPDIEPSSDSLVWQWCIRCGWLKLGAEVFKPGDHQELIIKGEVDAEPHH